MGLFPAMPTGGREVTHMVERVARALAAKNELIWDHMDEDATTIEEGRPYWRAMARAAIEAMREPSEAMLDAAEDHKFGAPVECYAVDVPALFSAMIDAALKEG